MFDLVANAYNLSHNSKEAMEKTNELLGIVIDKRAPKKRGRPTTVVREVREQKAPAEQKDRTEFYKTAHEALLNRPNAGWDYLIGRGLRPETIKQFQNIGYCEGWYSASHPNIRSDRVILGRTSTSYLARAIGQSSAPKMVVGSAGDFLQLNITEATRVFWVVEGEIDAYVLYQTVKDLDTSAGIISLCSTSNAKRVADLLLDLTTEGTEHTIILCLDNDEPGETATRRMLANFNKRRNVFLADEYKDFYRGANDIADANLANPKQFHIDVQSALIRAITGQLTCNPFLEAPEGTAPLQLDENGYFDLFEPEDTDELNRLADEMEAFERFSNPKPEDITAPARPAPEPAEVKLVDYLARTCGLCPSIAEVKAGTKTPKEHCRTCQSCRKNLKGYATLALYGGIQLLAEEITPSELLEPSSHPSELEGTTPQIVYVDRPRKKPQPKGKTATYHKRYGKAIRKKHSEGKSANQIAKELGISATTVRKLLDEFGLERAHKK
ncbi:MAG: toprim domain-containing protein [Alistipes sp.]|nr:toprim domain-containing protein [Alistipes sp.]